MLHKQRTSIASVLAIAVGAAIFAAACSDSGAEVGPVNFRPSSISKSLRHSLIKGHLTSAALHQKNQMDFVGVAHNLILKEIARQIRAGGASYSTICDSVVQWLGRPTTLNEIAVHLTPTARREMQAGVAGLHVCAHIVPAASAQRTTFSHRRSAYDDYLPDVEAAVGSATDADDLASSLSPIYDATLTMDSTDAAQVQGLVSVTQSSFEEWFDGSEVESEGAALESTLEGCGLGEMQGATTDMDANGVVWYCDNRKWVATAYRAPSRARTNLQFASVLPRFSVPRLSDPYTSAPSLARIWFGKPRRMCTISQAQTRDIVDGDAEGFSGGMFGGFWAGVAAAGGVSGYRAWKYDIMWAICAL